MRDLAALLPLPGGQLPSGFDADTVAEVLLYLAGKNLIELRSVLEPALALEWGAHLCQLYRSPEELLEMTVPFFSQGLRAHERCIWVVNAPLTVQAARDAMAGALAQAERHPDQISYHSFEEWYLDGSGRMKPMEQVLDAWVQAERRALNEGYLGLRISGDTLLLGQNWDDFMRYEASVHEAIATLRIKALCTYSALRARGELAEIMCNHHEVYAKHAHGWQPVRSPEAVFQR